MTKPKSAKTSSTKNKNPKPGGKGKTGVGGSTPPVEKSTADEDLVVFAFRLTPAERDLIHKAAGPAKASKYVRTLAVAAANGDEALVLQLLGGPAPATA
jgi:hypothetical protein